MLIVAVFVAYSAFGNIVSAEKVCHLVSFTYNGRMIWALETENSLECTQVAIGGHSSLEILPEKLLLFGKPDMLLTAGENVQEVLNKRRMYTFFNSKSSRSHSLPIEKGPFECLHQNASRDTTFTNNKNPFAYEEGVAPCPAFEQTSGCYCEPYNSTYVGVSDGNPRHCYCNTSPSGRCERFPQDCHELYKSGIQQCGVYTIQTTGPSQLRFNVYCNMKINDGGWTVFQRRRDNSVDFSQNWTAYEDGFGNLLGNFWLGNRKICHITQQRIYKLRIVRTHSSVGQLWSVYDNFHVNCSHENYKLASVGQFTGGGLWNLDGLTKYEGNEFNTYEKNEACESGWWCCLNCNDKTNLNGEYSEGMKWGGHQTYSYSEMKIKPY